MLYQGYGKEEHEGCHEGVGRVLWISKYGFLILTLYVLHGVVFYIVLYCIMIVTAFGLRSTAMSKSSKSFGR